jgi:Interferon-induced transmembrane protein
MSYNYAPPPQYGQPAGPPPNNYLLPAILTILCCWPLAIPAIVFAAQVNSKYNAGDLAGAAESSRRARLFTLIAFIVGLVGNAIYLLVYFSSR